MSICSKYHYNEVNSLACFVKRFNNGIKLIAIEFGALCPYSYLYSAKPSLFTYIISYEKIKFHRNTTKFTFYFNSTENHFFYSFNNTTKIDNSWLNSTTTDIT